MKRPIVYDITHLQSRTSFETPSGIDRIDLAFGRHFSSERKIEACIQYAWNYPTVREPGRLDDLVRRLEARWGERSLLEQDVKFKETKDWIIGTRPKASGSLSPERKKALNQICNDAKLYMERFYPAGLRRRPVAQDAIYLNIAQHLVQYEVFFSWLAVRPDVSAVFFLHDLIPLDFPEYWRERHRELFDRRVKTIFRRASALITSSASVRDRALEEMEARKIARVPIYCAALPSPTEIVLPQSDEDDALQSQPYFVVLGTIEPRKNHSLLLNVWRRLVSQAGPVPKLVVIGNRGWENENVVDMLERCTSISNHVWEVAGLSNAGITRLLANARALLMPSFAEGYGLPLIEALSVGTPVVASDIPVFHEVTQERAIFRDPIDGLGWIEAIMALADLQSPDSCKAREQARCFRLTTSDAYFEGLEAFLSTL
jgi:glycosyltransferase involved in cell wall biosynthesis